ncbi:hypothetical protein AMES_1945 [Amycolatopsis mediterranei S699]|uniref:Secreted protein n=2 Tax=Amycolatopsis mediterranei TaxID=33910 RepID=A0A0H3D0S6_AMYMU|nr:hypothetical protein [Amycolatopsis mediterranei]ADJ43769.1 hypothetical protein AMED_1961 [Amycolatopsis mediterranei U32]AEK40479.1 hypothetical protein RAM_09945 [Amycolatopsis mediterranei S699]AFO75481.1 hypothetical protein AMES_1945 [Amycolatopsis mediterranei S699]AGT82610.1 hypothetical protein B737_1946 [Amycolatopsis mediterranei RB]KDO08419.1 hypothetical protein DV26_23480 [Amycolatopsis mediterranei]
MRRRTAAFAALLAVVVLAPPAQAAAAVYGDFSLMFQRSAGQYAPPGEKAFQWAWSPQSATESEISWGDPVAWPPSYAEHFIRSGDWILLDGWGGNGTYYTERVTSESFCRGSTCSPISSDGGRQHYVRWNVPSSDYRLVADGTVTEQGSGRPFRFRHEQTWGAPAPCGSARFGAQTCVTQTETWSDDKDLPAGSPIRRTLHRSIKIAKGLGMAFAIDQDVPSAWHAEATAYWKW